MGEYNSPSGFGPPIQCLSPKTFPHFLYSLKVLNSVAIAYSKILSALFAFSLSGVPVSMATEDAGSGIATLGWCSVAAPGWSGVARISKVPKRTPPSHSIPTPGPALYSPHLWGNWDSPMLPQALIGTASDCVLFLE